jgi:hypothetical protein
MRIKKLKATILKTKHNRKKKLEDKTFEGELFALESHLTGKEKSVVRQLHISVVF